MQNIENIISLKFPIFITPFKLYVKEEIMNSSFEKAKNTKVRTHHKYLYFNIIDHEDSDTTACLISSSAQLRLKI